MTEIRDAQTKVQSSTTEQATILKSKTVTEILSTPVRTYKDRIFRMIFKDKEEFLTLYNAMNGTDYDNSEDLVVTTLENAIYMGMRNDVSFLLYDKLTLYEHQSTNNPNMPLRDLFYVADVYSNLTKDEDLYGSRQIIIPEPKFIVFYNGVEELPERFEMKLSNMFETISEDVSLELKTQVFNINLGYNRALMEKCKTLHDYAMFVDLVRRYRKNMKLEEAIDQAVTECIEKGVLAEFLKKNRAEVIKMGIYEYNEEEHLRKEREYAEKRGWDQGWKECERYKIIELVCKLMKKGMSVSEISNLFDENEQLIQKIYDTALPYAPNYNIDKIFEEMWS